MPQPPPKPGAMPGFFHLQEVRDIEKAQLQNGYIDADIEKAH